MRYALAWLAIVVVTLISVAGVQSLTKEHPLLGLFGYVVYLVVIVMLAYAISVVL